MLWLMLKPLDVIELSVAVDAWEAGTIATGARRPLDYLRKMASCSTCSD